VGIGDTSYTDFSAVGQGNRILAPLDLTGWMRVGSTFTGTPPGQDLIVMRDTPDLQDGLTASSRVVIGSDQNTGNLVIGWGVRPNRTNSNAYISSFTGTHDRSALVMGSDGTHSSLIWRAASDNNTTVNSAVTLTDVLKIVAPASPAVPVTFLSGNLGVGKTPTTTLDVNGTISGITLALSAKATSAATVSTDAATTLTTKGYVDGFDSAIVAQIPGIGQTWSVIANTDRISGTGYQNTTTKPIMVSVTSNISTLSTSPTAIQVLAEVAPNTGSAGAAGTYVAVASERNASPAITATNSMAANASFIVPPNHYYRVTITVLNATTSTTTWSELR
jgi:hypothetical protein